MPREERANVLLVDDEPANLLVLETALKDIDANLVQANSGEEALKRLLDQDFAVILMDVRMPGMSGLETASYIRKRERSEHTPLIFITAASPDEASTFSGYELGAVDYLYKPIVPEILRSKVCVFIELYKKSRELVELKQKEDERKLSEMKQLWEAERLREMVRHERELAKASALFRLVVSRVRDYAIFITDPAGNIRTWNAAAERILGYSEAEIIGKHISIIFTAEDNANGIPQCEMDRALSEGKAEDVRWHVRRDGTRFWAEGSTTPLTDEAGGILGFAKLMRDNTERKRWEEEIRSLTANLERSNKELERFAAVASHDLKEPLRTISTQMGLLALRYKGKLDPDADELIGFAVDAAQRMRWLIESILNYSRIGREKTNVEEVDCTDVVREIVTSLDAAVKESGADISIESLPIIEADRSQIQQLVQNLIGNAIKFRRAESPKIRIWAEQHGREWLFSVSDNGIGMDPDDLGKIFEPFLRLHSKAEYPGSGLGLAICKKIVELHGGRLWVESKENEGSTFHFTLPSKEPVAKAS